jgi:hypothetical protein
LNFESWARSKLDSQNRPYSRGALITQAVASFPPRLNQNLISEDDQIVLREPGTEYEEEKISRPHDVLSSSPGTFRVVSFSSFVSERLGYIVKIDKDILSAKIH